MCGGNPCGAVLVKVVFALQWNGLLSGVFVFMGLSLSELPHIKWQCTELWLLNVLGECCRCCAAVASGVLGSKDEFSLVSSFIYQYHHLRWSQSD